MSDKTRRAQDKREAFYLQEREGRRDSDTSKEIQYLIKEASDLVGSRSYAQAVWRLVDAAGLCVRLVGVEEKKDNLIGYSQVTGRGFKLNEGI